MHLSMLIITHYRPGEKDIYRILAPWNDGSTGIDDEYVIDEDVTEDVMRAWERPVPAVRLADGSLHSKYDSRFYGTSEGELLERRRKFMLPEGAEEIEIPQSELSAATGQTLREFAEEDGDYKEHGGRFYIRTNPNAKWDWYQIGGGWSGFFAPNYDPEDDPKNKETCYMCGGSGKRTDMQVENGCNVCNGTGMATKWPTERTPGNQVQVSKLPLKELTLEAESKAAANYDKFHKALAGRPYPDWKGLVAEHGVEKAREIFNNDPAVEAVRDAWFHFSSDEEVCYLRPREEFLKAARERVLETSVVVKDGEWYERGENGEEWSKQFAALLDDLSPDDWLTIVDCHI